MTEKGTIIEDLERIGPNWVTSGKVLWRGNKALLKGDIPAVSRLLPHWEVSDEGEPARRRTDSKTRVRDATDDELRCRKQPNESQETISPSLLLSSELRKGLEDAIQGAKPRRKRTMRTKEQTDIMTDLDPSSHRAIDRENKNRVLLTLSNSEHATLIRGAVQKLT